MGTPRRKRSRSKTGVAVIVVLVASLLALVAPDSWSGKLLSVVQIIAPFQDATSLAAKSVSNRFGDDTTSVARADYDSLARRNEAAEHRAASLALRVDELEREVAILSASRLWELDGGGIGARGRLIPARVITPDLVPWRSSRLISAGSVHGVSRGDPVASRFFTIDEGDKVGVRDGMAIVLGEVFVGVVEQTATHQSYIKLLSDVSVELKVRIGRFSDDGFATVDRYFWLTGRGNGEMEIGDVETDDVDTGAVQVGDVVLSDPLAEMLPAAMTIGRVASITPDRANPLFSILSIESAVSGDLLQRVYVFDPNSPHD